MALLQLCEQYFNTSNLYEVLQISENATEKEVNQAYRMLSLKIHPDRVTEDKKLEATEKFKVLGAVHAILSDKDKRATYNETKGVDEETITDSEWKVYWKLYLHKLTEDTSYEKFYIGSKEERDHFKFLYLTGKGDMDYIFEELELASTENEPRIRGILTEMIEKGEIPAYEIFTQEPKKKGIIQLLRKIERHKRQRNQNRNWNQNMNQNWN